MEDRINQLMIYILNEQKHLQLYQEQPSIFKQPKKQQQKQVISANSKPLLKGQFYSYNKVMKNFKQFYFELHNNVLMRFQDKTKTSPAEQVLLQSCQIREENQVLGDSVAYGIVLQSDDEIAKLVTDKFNSYEVWKKALKRFCKSSNFIQRYKVENRMYDHFYKCADKKKKIYQTVKIVNIKGLRPEQKKLAQSEIQLFRNIQCPLLPKLKKIYEDDSYMYMTFDFFQGDDLFKIINASKLEEIAIATLTHHVLKGLKSLHSQNVYHGNLKLDNIIFGSSQKEENEIFFINLKHNDEMTEFYRESLIKKGTNMYIAPEVLEGFQIGPEMDMFSLGVCLFYMAFGKFPYSKIERVSSSQTNSNNNNFGFNNISQNGQYSSTKQYRYELDLKILETLQKEKKLNLQKQNNHILSASGIDLLIKLLDINPETRITAQQALTHHWFINFTTKPTDNKKMSEYRQNKNMQSLITILECSEMSEREQDFSRFSKLRGLTLQTIHSQQTSKSQQNLGDNILNKSNHNSNFNNNIHSHLNNSNFNNNNDASTVYTQGEVINDEECVLNSLMKTLDQLQQPKLMNRARQQYNSSTSQAIDKQSNYIFTQFSQNSINDCANQIM